MLNNGLIIQFGTNTFPGSELKVTYPVGFTTNFTKIAIIVSGSTVSSGFATALKEITETTVTLIKSTNVSGNRCRWISIGF